MTFPNDALNVRADLHGNGTSTLLSVPGGSTYTVLYESYNTGSNDANSQFQLLCGSNTLLTVNSFSRNPQIERFKMAKCTADITTQITGTTGTPTTTVSLVYAPYDTAASSTQQVAVVNPEVGYVMIGLMLLITIAGIDLLRRVFAPVRKI